jgi:nanoRNase/pAp phosphatase (c-di-AMP/oligoRNAs hydrolase)
MELDIRRSSDCLEQMLDICEKPGPVLVLMQNNPDPDAIASAMSVEVILHRHLKKGCVIGYAGMLGRAENRAMVEQLKIDVRRVRGEDLADFPILILVDTQPRSGNNALTSKRRAQVVIDHHTPPKRGMWQADLVDVRPEYGATSTILYEYLMAAKIKPDARLATALHYGIRSDTQDLGRAASARDIEVFQQLVALSDKHKLARIRLAPVPDTYFAMLHAGLENTELAGRTVFTFVPEAEHPDIFAEIAELMLRLDSARTSVCYGVCGDTVFLSARAADARGNMATRMKRTVSRIGTGGGHRSMAGGQVPITAEPAKRLELVRARIIEHFANGQPPIKLLPDA